MTQESGQADAELVAFFEGCLMAISQPPIGDPEIDGLSTAGMAAWMEARIRERVTKPLPSL
jgi:hypothetical protein